MIFTTLTAIEILS